MELRPWGTPVDSLDRRTPNLEDKIRKSGWWSPETRLRHARVLNGLALLSGLVGCVGGDHEAPAASTFMELDSAGVRVVVTPGSDAFAPLGWDLDSIPEIVLGLEEAPSGPFMRVVGAEILPGGEIIVLDAGRRELLRFDAGGRELARRGGMGQGPGEFVQPALVPTAGNDSVIVYDIAQARVTVFSPDLETMRIQRLESDPELYGWDPQEPKRWVVFDPAGRAHGTVRTPVDFEVHSIGADRVLGVWRSQWGEEFVHGYRLRRIGG